MENTGDTPLLDDTFGTESQLTISSEGYIAGNNFKITKAGSAEFNDLRARANVDLGNIKNQVTTTAITRSGTVSSTLNGNELFPGIYRKVVTSITGISSRPASYITALSFYESPTGTGTAIRYRLLLYNNTTFLGYSEIVSKTNNKAIIVPLLTRLSFNRIDIEALYGVEYQGGTFNFTYNISSSTLTEAVINNLIDPLYAQDAVTLQYLEDNYNIATFSTGVSISGGTIQEQRKIEKRAGANGTDRIVEYFIRGTVTSSLGEAVLTLSTALPNSFILVSPYRNSANGSGVDVFYGFKTSNSVYRVRHDYASDDNNRVFVAHIVGYDSAP